MRGIERPALHQLQRRDEIELVELVAAELRNHEEYADTDASSVVIIEQHPLWLASLRRQGPRPRS